MKPDRRQFISSVVFFVSSLGIVLALAAGLLLHAYRLQLKEDLEASLERLAHEIISQRLYEYPLADVYRQMHRIDISDPLYDDLTISYHPQRPAPLTGSGLFKKLPDGRFLTVSSSLTRVDAKTYSLAKELGVLLGTLLVLLGGAYAFFLGTRALKKR